MAIFCRAVDAGSFSAAARQLRLTPSAVSKQITRLENRLGVRLLNRTTRRLNLTDEGRAFYERSKLILAEIDEVEQAITEAQSSARGKLRINAPVALGRRQIVPLLPRFMRQHPQVAIDLELTDRTINMLEEHVDVLVRAGAMSDSSLVARRLGSIRRVICASPEYLRKYGVPQHPDDLARHNCLLLNYATPLNEWLLHGPDGRRAVRVNGNFSANINGVLHSAVLAGIGVAMIASFIVAADFRAGRLVPVLADYPGEPMPLYVVYPHRRHLSPRVRAFVDFLVGEFTPHPPWEN